MARARLAVEGLVISLGRTGHDGPADHDLRIEEKLGPTMQLRADRLGLSV